MRHRRRFRYPSSVGLAGVMVLLLAVPGATAPASAAMAWIDAPLSGSTIAPGEVGVTAHATDPSGVVSIRLWVDGAPIDAADVHGTHPILASAELSWTPDATGEYVLMVRGIGVNGEWSAPGTAVVIVEGEPAAPSPSATPTQEASPSARPLPTLSSTPGIAPTAAPTTPPTPRPTPRPSPRPMPSPTPSPAPTPAPCTPSPAPVLTQPPSGTVIRDPAQNPPTFTWAHRTPPSCPPIGYRIQVFDDPDLAGTVHDVTIGPVTSWRPRLALPDCATYHWRVAAIGNGDGLGAWSTSSSLELFVGRCDEAP